MLEVIQNFWHFDLDLSPSDIFVFVSIQALCFECLKPAAAFSVWRYVFRMSRTPLSFKVVESVSRSRSRNSGNTQVCAPLGRGLICTAWLCRESELHRLWICRLQLPGFWHRQSLLWICRQVHCTLARLLYLSLSLSYLVSGRIWILYNMLFQNLVSFICSSCVQFAANRFQKSVILVWFSFVLVGTYFSILYLHVREFIIYKICDC